jgi:hypothetical protein
MTAKLTKQLGWMTAVALVTTAAMETRAAAAVPARLTEQGRLFQAGGNTPVSGTVSMVFAIYAERTGGTALWTETFSVDLDNGYFSVQLGSTVPFPATLWDGSARFIGVKVGTDAEMTPREEVVSVPYALRSDVADRVGTIAPTDVVTGVTGGAGITATKTGNSVSLTLDTASLQQRVSGMCPAGSAISSIAATGSVSCQAVAMTTYSAAVGGGLTLSGTAFAVDNAVVARKDGAAGNQAFDTSTLFLDYATNRVGVNTATPAAPLDVVGRTRATGYDYASAQTGSVFLAGNAFVPDVSATGAQWNINSGWGNFLSASATMSVTLGASVNLPQASSLTGLTCYVYDNDATNNISGTAYLRLRPFAGATATGSTTAITATLSTTTGAEATTAQAKTGTLATPTVIDNNTNGYFMYVSFGTTPNLATALYFLGCRITYSYQAVTF